MKKMHTFAHYNTNTHPMPIKHKTLNTSTLPPPNNYLTFANPKRTSIYTETDSIH